MGGRQKKLCSVLRCSVSQAFGVHVHWVPDKMFLCLFGTVVDSCLLLERKRDLLQKCRGLKSLAKRKLWLYNI